MSKLIKGAVKSAITGTIRAINKTDTGRYFFNRVVSTAMEQSAEVSHAGLKLKFATPNGLCDWRARTFATKEPETLEWIENMKEGSTLWDIGANVGLYSVYAAKKRNCKVYAFEPSIFNVELLARNIEMNDLVKQICIIPIPLSDKSGASNMQLTTTEWGGALSTFDQDFGWDGKAIKKVFEFQTIGLSMEDAANLLNIPTPEYIKIDVDGLEHFILKGGKSVLSKINEILIEVNDDFLEQADQCREVLTECGLFMKEKKHSEIIASNTQGFENSYNQIWCRV
jgi:FkbM family methyltransferase